MATFVLYPETPDSRMVQLDKEVVLIGRAADADIQLDLSGISEHHARIERKVDGYYIIALVPSAGIAVNGEETTFAKLKNGDLVKIGDAIAGFHLTDEDDFTGGAGSGYNAQHLPVHAASGPLAMHPMYGHVCSSCGSHLSPGVQSCPHCGAIVSNLPTMPLGYIPPVPSHQSAAGILPILAFLAGLTVVGGPVALVLGLMSLSIIRRRGGTLRDRSMAKWAVGLGLVWTMLGFVGAGGLVWRSHRREVLNRIETYESKVIRAMKNLACAQKYAHTIEFYDADEDGNGEYGSLSALRELQSPFFDKDLADGEAYKYRFTIREASEGQFLAIAEPFNYDKTGGRTFVIDQLGQIRGKDAEGIRYGQIASEFPVLQGERSAYYEIDDEIAKDVLNYLKGLSSSPEDYEKRKRIIARLRKDYSLTTVGRELEGIETTVNRFVAEQRAQYLYEEAREALQEGNQDVALAKLTEIVEELPSFSQVAAVERQLSDLRSAIAHRREVEAAAMFTEAEQMERQGTPQQEVQQLFLRIMSLYPETDVAARITTLKPEMERQVRESQAEKIFSELMELSPEKEYEMILSQGNQLRRNYNDTDLFGKIESDLADKERKARAMAWRIKTSENMEKGRMRGALAQLESAIRENPDLQYDLRDMCITLYRHAAETLLEEGDSRGALAYYAKLDGLLQSSGKTRVDLELMARLRHEVGMEDFERKEYSEARWNLAGAAWKYDTNAQFNIRLGAASLYTGLYRPAEVALEKAITIENDSEQALLYHAYMSMRLVLVYEELILDSFMVKNEADPFTQQKEPENDRPLIVEVNTARKTKTTDQDGTETFTEVVSDDDKPKDKERMVRERTVVGSSAASQIFSSLQIGGEATDSPVPAPVDLDLSFHYDNESNRNLMPNLLLFLQDLADAIQGFKDELSFLKPGEAKVVQLGQVMLVSEYRNRLSDLRALHLQDVEAQKQLIGLLEDIRRRLDMAAIAISKAGEKQPGMKSLSEHLLPQINAKRGLITKCTAQLTEHLKKEYEMRQKIFGMAEESMRASLQSGQSQTLDKTSGLSDSFHIKQLMNKNDSVSQIDQALISLRNAMEVQVDMEDVLRAAEGM